MIRQLEFMGWTFTAACKSFSGGKRYGDIFGRDDGVLICCGDRTRPGERVAKRRRCKSKVGASHRINQTETIKWFKNRFEGIVRGDRS